MHCGGTGNCDVSQFQFKVCGNQICRGVGGWRIISGFLKMAYLTLNVKICESESVVNLSHFHLQKRMCFSVQLQENWSVYSASAGADIYIAQCIDCFCPNNISFLL